MNEHVIKPVLIVDDSPAIAQFVSKSIITDTGHSTKVVYSYQQAYQLLHQDKVGFLAAVVDLTLPDALNGEVADLTIQAGIPTIVLTGQYSDEVRSRILSKDIVDYFLKIPGSLQLIHETILRLERNLSTRVLVAASSAILRSTIRRMLHTHCFDILEAKEMDAALKIQENNKELRLAIIGNPENSTEGIDLVSKLRERCSPDELAIVGVSSSESSSISVRFLKFGADDILKIPFEKEEFFCRIYRSIKTIESIEKIKRAAYTDTLTGLANRLCFFREAVQVLDQARSGGLSLAVAMIDIDFFKRINDTYGHAGGDSALKRSAILLRNVLKDADVISRFGGEEFCVLMSCRQTDGIQEVFEQLRKAFEAEIIQFNTRHIRFTISIGVCVAGNCSLEEMIKGADESLYQAKNAGRNRVVVKLE
ncbi:MAG: diguanylate cyclase [Deltaproteobacteria bacterium]|nr:diguanylate cyclase [Deltaproteobacteria bacterium]